MNSWLLAWYGSIPRVACLPVCLFSPVFTQYVFFFFLSVYRFCVFLTRRKSRNRLKFRTDTKKRNTRLQARLFQFYQSRFYKPLVAPRCFGVWRPLKKKSSLRRCGRMSLATYTVWFTYAFSILFENVYFVTWKYIRFFQSVTHWRYPEIQRQNASFAPPQAI